MLPPDTYRTTGLLHPVATLPISICPTQWFTPIIGFPQSCESVLAHTAHERNGPPMPGPFVNAMQSTCAGVTPACSRASRTSATMCCNTQPPSYILTVNTSNSHCCLASTRHKNTPIPIPIPITPQIRQTYHLMMPGRFSGQKSLSRGRDVRLPRVADNLIAALCGVPESTSIILPLTFNRGIVAGISAHLSTPTATLLALPSMPRQMHGLWSRSGGRFPMSSAICGGKIMRMSRFCGLCKKIPWILLSILRQMQRFLSPSCSLVRSPL